MRVLLSKFCEYAVKQENGRHSMVGIFDDIRVPEMPIDHPPFFCCIQLELDPTETGREFTLEAILVDEDGKEFFGSQLQGGLPREPGAHPVKVFVQIGLPPQRFEKEGMYRLDVLVNGTKIGEERLPVYVVYGPEGVPPTEPPSAN